MCNLDANIQVFRRRCHRFCGHMFSSAHAFGFVHTCFLVRMHSMLWLHLFSRTCLYVCGSGVLSDARMPRYCGHSCLCTCICFLRVGASHVAWNVRVGASHVACAQSCSSFAVVIILARLSFSSSVVPAMYCFSFCCVVTVFGELSHFVSCSPQGLNE